MAVVTTFLVNLLCSVVSCDVKLPGPEIGDDLGGPNSALASSIYPTELREPWEQDPVVHTHYGSVRGFVMKTAGNRNIYAFQGIPYAQPPVGDVRFRSAVPITPWSGIRDARSTSPDCLQLSVPRSLRVVGNEDCLYLNIYTPLVPGPQTANRASPKLPVIVSIHGGGYFFGSGAELGPSYLLDKDVILVTFNYRLGVLGFLSSGDENSPGNYGLKDQSLAIRMIYDIIHKFGGDPTRITLIGQSSGAASAQMHLFSNMTSPYISSGMSISGSAYTFWAFKSPQESWRLTSTLSRHVSCPTQDTTQMMRCLRSKNPVDLVAAQYKLLEFAPFPQTLFSPVIEPLSPEAFITEKPDRLYATDHVPRKPWIFTTVAQEGYLGLLFVQSVVGEGSLRSRWEELAPIYLDYKYTARNVSATTKMLTKFYFGRMSPKNVPESKLAAIFGDRLMLPGINKALEVHSQHAPTYAAIFGFKGKYTLGRMVGRRASDWGVGHTDDLFYYFNSSTYVPGFKKADVAELAMSNIMTTFLANFAHTGEPLLPQEPSVFAGLWQPVQPHNVQFLQLNKEIKMIPQPFKKRLKFWRQVQEFDPLLLDPLLSL